MIEKCNLSGDYFSAYLHQNYLEFFSEISDVVRASEYLSDSDFMTFEWSVSIRSFVTIKENHCLSLNLNLNLHALQAFHDIIQNANAENTT